MKGPRVSVQLPVRARLRALAAELRFVEGRDFVAIA